MISTHIFMTLEYSSQYFLQARSSYSELILALFLTANIFTARMLFLITNILAFSIAENAGAVMSMELGSNIYQNQILHVVVLRVLEGHGLTQSTKHVLIQVNIHVLYNYRCFLFFLI